MQYVLNIINMGCSFVKGHAAWQQSDYFDRLRRPGWFCQWYSPQATITEFTNVTQRKTSDTMPSDMVWKCLYHLFHLFWRRKERCLTTYRTHSTGLYYLGYLNILCPLAYSTSSGYHYYLWKIRGSSHCTVCRALNILIRQRRDICAVSGTCVLCLVWLFSSLIKQNIN